MSLVDLRPLPIPLLVRYELIDSCVLVGRYQRGMPRLLSPYAGGLKIRRGGGEGREKRRKRSEERKGEVEVADEKGGVISRRNETEFMPRRSWHLLVLRTCHAAAPRAELTNELIH